MRTLFLFIYRIVVIPPVVTALPIVALFSRKLRLGLRLRRHAIEPLASSQQPIWIHAASGEFEYAKPVIRELKARNPAQPIVVTYFSPTFAGAIERFPDVDRSMALPLDLPGPCNSFLRRMRPRLCLVARTDLWPEMLEQCRRQSVPVVVFSYTQKSFHSPFKRFFTQWIMGWVKNVYCVSSADRENLNQIPLGGSVEVMGDTRYDQVNERLSHPRPISPELHPGTDTPVLVAGSTWSEDEAILLPALQSLLKEKRLKLVLVPHEPTPSHIESLKAQAQKMGLSYALFSQGRSWSQADILLVDQVGYLAELYAWGKLAFIGGSFRKSVHSVMEALGAGCISFVGPYHLNNREAIEFQHLSIRSRPGLEVVINAEQLRVKVQEALKTSSTEFQQDLRAEFTRRLGASRRLVDRIQDLL